MIQWWKRTFLRSGSYVGWISILGEEGSEQLSHYSHSILIFKDRVTGILLMVGILDWFVWEEKWPEIWIHICLQCRRPWFSSWIGKFPWRRDWLPTAGFLGFSAGSDGKESPCNAGELDSIPGLGRSLGEGNGYPLQYSALENSMDHIVLEIANSWTQLSDFHFTSPSENSPEPKNLLNVPRKCSSSHRCINT